MRLNLMHSINPREFEVWWSVTVLHHTHFQFQLSHPTFKKETFFPFLYFEFAALKIPILYMQAIPSTLSLFSIFKVF